MDFPQEHALYWFTLPRSVLKSRLHHSNCATHGEIAHNIGVDSMTCTMESCSDGTCGSGERGFGATHSQINMHLQTSHWTSTVEVFDASWSSRMEIRSEKFEEFCPMSQAKMLLKHSDETYISRCRGDGSKLPTQERIKTPRLRRDEGKSG